MQACPQDFEKRASSIHSQLEICGMFSGKCQKKGFITMKSTYNPRTPPPVDDGHGMCKEYTLLPALNLTFLDTGICHPQMKGNLSETGSWPGLHLTNGSTRRA